MRGWVGVSLLAQQLLRQLRELGTVLRHHAVQVLERAMQQSAHFVYSSCVGVREAALVLFTLAAQRVCTLSDSGPERGHMALLNVSQQLVQSKVSQSIGLAGHRADSNDLLRGGQHMRPMCTGCFRHP